MAEGQGSAGNVIAALASVVCSGLGQLIQGRPVPALLFFIFTYGGYALWWFLLFPAVIGGIVHLCSIISAAMWKPRG
jgi:TM2 domain-containing membrane protein YozV